MSHILLRLGEAALQFRKVGSRKWLPPIIGRRHAMHIRKQWMEDGREWPFEHLVPGIPKNDPPYRGGRQKGHKRDVQREERQKNIQEALAKMPQLIAEHRAARRIPWDQVTPVDKLLLTPQQLRQKYVTKKLK